MTGCSGEIVRSGKLLRIFLFENDAIVSPGKNVLI